MLNVHDNSLFSVSKIAVFNPYLQGGHTETAEIESITRFMNAAKKRSIDAKMFGKAEEIELYDPDLIVSITFQEGKLTKYPTYMEMNVAISLIGHVPRFVRNVLSCDGFFTASPKVSNKWLHHIFSLNNKQAEIGWGYFTLGKTEFFHCDFNNATLMYLGTNWDGLRHHDLFQLLHSGNYIKCYGPKKSWAQYPASLYGGEIPFDGMSTLNTYRKHGAGLCLGLAACDMEGITNNRLFETAAAGVLPICSHNEFTKDTYGDSVLYVDRNASTTELAEQIIESIQWIRSNPETAREMAKRNHDIFNDKLSADVFIDSLLIMHKNTLLKKGYINSDSHNNSHDALSDTNKSVVHHQNKQKITYILPTQLSVNQIILTLQEICKQTYNCIDVVILTKSPFFDVKKLSENITLKNLKVHSILYDGMDANKQLLNYLKENKTDWVGILSTDQKLFPNHTACLLSTFSRYHNPEKKSIAGLLSGSLEHSNYFSLPELMRDEHNIYSQNKVRIGHTAFSQEVALGSLVLNINLLPDDFFRNIDLYNIDSIQLMNEVTKIGSILETKEITCSISGDRLLIEQKLNDFDKSEEMNRLQEEIAKLQHIVEGHGQKVTDLEKIVLQKEQNLNDICSSLSWKLLKPLRKFTHLYRLVRSRAK